MIVRELLFHILFSGPDETFSAVQGGLVDKILVPLFVKLRNWKMDRYKFDVSKGEIR